MEKIEVKEFTLQTRREFQIVDITEKVKKFVVKEKVKEGEITITTKHTTTAIIVNEDEKRLLKDMQQHLYEIAPKGRPYMHDDIEKRACPKNEPKNAHAHLKAILMGASETLPIKNGKLDLGTWQRILFMELDGPRKRKYSLELIAKT